MPKYLQVSRYLVQDFSVVDLWTVVLESTTQPFFFLGWRHATLEDAAMRDGTYIKKKKKNGCLGDHNFCGQKRAVLKLKFQAVQSEYKVWFFFLKLTVCVFENFLNMSYK